MKWHQGLRSFALGVLGFYRGMEFVLMQVYASLKEKLAVHRLFRLRQRYVMTRDNRVRLRYVTGVFTVVCALSILMLSLSFPSFAFKSQSAASLTAPHDVAHGHFEGGQDFSPDFHAKLSGSIRKAADALRKPEQPKFREVEVGKGETVAGLLQDAGLSGSEAYYAVKALNKHFDVRKVKSGQKIGLHYEPGENGLMKFAKMEMKLNPVKQVSILRKGPEDFVSELEEKELVQRAYGRKARIKTSLYGSAAQANIPTQVIAELIRIYSWDIDFQRDIRQGDELEVLYEAYETEDGEFARYGEVLYANLSVGGKDVPIYRYEMKDGRVDYFEPDGMSIRKTLMKTPVDGARISSGFGMRRHPVLGYNKMHKGMDFAAPTGTPIYAAGDGVIEHAGRKGSYGNYVRIRHNGKLKTAYAHMHRIGKGISVGKRVEQGQVIGYVGTTGRSTGPHLHYEVLVNNKQVNPKSVDLPTGEQLTGQEKKRFKSLIGSVYQQYVSLTNGMKVAEAKKSDSAQGEPRS